MRIKLECVLEDKVIPISYNRRILSFFKKSLEEYEPEIKENFYENNLEKDMTFSCFFPIEKIEDKKIYLKENIFKIYLSFNSILEGIHFYNSFIKQEKKRTKFLLGENNFYIQDISKIQEKTINDNVVIFKTLSPIIIREKREKQKDWYHILDENGIKILKKNLQFNLQKRFSLKALEEIEIIPLDIKKVIINVYDIKLAATKGLIAIKGEKEILNFLYKSGIGSKKSSGYGMLEIVK